MYQRLILVLLVIVAVSGRLGARAQTTWLINNTTNIGGYVVGKFGNPQIISTPYGNAIQFNGVNDGLVVSNNPLAGMTNMTVEMIFRHDPLTVPAAWQPRIVHVQATTTDHRVTLETRVGTNTTPNTFLLDTFLRLGSTAGINNNTLTNGNFPHPIADWAHMAITFDGATFKNYVNGSLELSTNLTGPAFAAGGVTSVGMRANQVNYFQGAVLALRFTPRALGTNEFMCVPKTVLSAPVLAGGAVQLDFNLTSGLPLGFTLQQADQPGGPWQPNGGAVLTTNTPGISYRFTVATNGPAQFFRLSYP